MKDVPPPFRFALLHHTDWPGHADHFDLMLQTESGASDDAAVLWTFSTLLPAFPDPANGAVELRRIANHRRAYLLYEGPVSQGRGRVTQVDSGTCVFPFCPTAFYFEVFGFRLEGSQLRGDFLLQRIKSDLYRFVVATDTNLIK